MNKVKILIQILVAIVSVSCNYGKKTIIKKTAEGLFMEANYLNDSTIDGVAKYYDDKGNLASYVTFDEGMKEGIALNFYSNKTIKDSAFFQDGRKHGFSLHYDSLGNLEWKDYQFYGIKVGPQFFYKSGKLNRYFFTNFSGEDILALKYDSLGNCNKIDSFTTQPILSNSIDNGKPAVSLFMFLPKPPNIETRFELGLTNENGELDKLFEIKSDEIFFDTVLPVPKEGSFYYVSTHFKSKNDSINKTYIEEMR